MSHLDAMVRLDTLVARGALDLYDERLVRRWFGGRDALTVDEALQVRAPAPILFWAVLREYLVGARVLHQLAVDVAGEFLRRRTEQGTYVDFRTGRALAAKQDWIDGRISLGELVVAATAAEHAAALVIEHDDPEAWPVARIVVQALEPEPDEAVSQTYYAFLAAFGGKDDSAWLVDQARRRLAE